jgi:hypothetical protein
MDMYNIFIAFLKDKKIHLDKEMFSAVLMSLKFKEAGNATRTANLMAYAIKLHDKTDGYKINVEKFEKLAELSSEVWRNK